MSTRNRSVAQDREGPIVLTLVSLRSCVVTLPRLRSYIFPLTFRFWDLPKTCDLLKDMRADGRTPSRPTGDPAPPRSRWICEEGQR
jgi:hypothetical protein